jgi:anti-anti-sigma factor
MDISQRSLQGISVVSVQGRLDAVSAPELESALEGAEPGHLVLNMAGLEYISSAGLRVILAAAKRQKGDSGDLHVAALQEAVKSVFEVSGFDAIINIYDSEAAAVEAVTV